jgi:hypothetical protein
MQDNSSTPSEQFGAEPAVRDESSQSSDRAYQTLTIAAILLVLGSLWLF